MQPNPKDKEINARAKETGKHAIESNTKGVAYSSKNAPKLPSKSVKVTKIDKAQR